MLSVGTADKGTLITATVDCPVGEVLLGGGATVTTTQDQERVALTRSYPADTDTWSATGVVLVKLATNVKMTVTPYAICTA